MMPSLRERISEHLKQGPVELAKLAANPRAVTLLHQCLLHVVHA